LTSDSLEKRKQLGMNEKNIETILNNKIVCNCNQLNEELN